MRKISHICAFFCAALCLFLTAAGPAQAQCEIESVAMLGSIDLGDMAEDIAISGSYAYVGLGDSGLKIVDVSNPMALRTVATLQTSSYVRDIAVSEPYAFMSDGRLNVVDISDPTTPVVISSLDVGTIGIENIAVSGSYVYAACWWDGLMVIDVSDPHSPQVVGSVETGAIAWDVGVAGFYAYVTQWAGGEVKVVDISDPCAPSIVTTIEDTDNTWTIAVAGSYAYLVDSYSGSLQIADISAPSSASVVGSIHTWYGSGVSVSDSYAYLADGKIEVVNISDPTSPHVVNSFWIDSNRLTTNITIAGSLAYVTYRTVDSYNQGGLQVVDISSMLPLPLVNTLDWTAQYPATDMAVSGEYAYMAREWNGIDVVDISDPVNPAIVETISTPGSAWGLAISGSYLYEADSPGGLHVVDISDPPSPSIVASVQTPGEAVDVAISGAYAYVADGSSGLQIIDISNPLSPFVAGSISAAGGIEAVAVSGPVACVMGSGFIVHIVDVTDPTAPQLLGAVNMPNWANAIAMSGSYAYAADVFAGIQVLDLTDPANLHIFSSLGFPEYGSDIEIYGSLMYVTGGMYETMLHIIDVSNPAFPRTVASADMEGRDGYGVVAASGSCAYVDEINVVQICRNPLASPTIAFSTTALSASNEQGINPPQQYFDVSNSGDGTLSYTLSTDAWWLEFDPLMGGSLGESDTIEVTFRTKDLSPGNHAARLFVADPAAVNNPQTIDVTVTVYAAEYTLTTEASPVEGGTVTGGGTYDYGTEVIVEAHPNPGWKFYRWEGEQYPFLHSKNNPEHAIIREDQTVTAVFQPVYPRLTADASPAEGGRVSGDGIYSYEETAVIEAHPYARWQFDHWEGDDIDGSTQNPEQLTMDADKAVTAVFAPAPLTRINLATPYDGYTLSRRPTFSWTTGAGTNTHFAVDIGFAPGGPFYSTYEKLGLIIENESWTMPQIVWDMIPSGRTCYWRVRGRDLDAAMPTVITSHEVWSFYKP